MVDNLIDGCVSFMVQRGAIPNTDEQLEIYRYGMELQIYYIIHAFVLLGIGFLFGQALNVALLLFLFGLIQSNGGGYHADTHGKCLGLMILGVLAFLALMPLYRSNAILQAVSLVIGLAVVISLAPVAHRNHPLNPQKSVVLGKRAKVLAGIISFLWCVFAFFNVWPDARGVIAITMAFTGISIFTAWLKKRSETAH